MESEAQARDGGKETWLGTGERLETRRTSPH